MPQVTAHVAEAQRLFMDGTNFDLEVPLQVCMANNPVDNMQRLVRAFHRSADPHRLCLHVADKHHVSYAEFGPMPHHSVDNDLHVLLPSCPDGIMYTAPSVWAAIVAYGTGVFIFTTHLSASCPVCLCSHTRQRRSPILHWYGRRRQHSMSQSPAPR